MFYFCQMGELRLGNCDSNITERLKRRAINQQRENHEYVFEQHFTYLIVISCRKEVEAIAVAVGVR